MKGWIASGKVWPMLVCAFIALDVVIVGVTIIAAHSDPSFAVEPDYYSKALHWDDAREEQERSNLTGWSADLAVAVDRLVEVRLTSSKGAPVEGAVVSAECFARLRAKDRSALTFTEVSPGVYRAALGAGQSGRWIFRVRAMREEECFVGAFERPVAGSAS